MHPIPDPEPIPGQTPYAFDNAPVATPTPPPPPPPTPTDDQVIGVAGSLLPAADGTKDGDGALYSVGPLEMQANAVPVRPALGLLVATPHGGLVFGRGHMPGVYQDRFAVALDGAREIYAPRFDDHPLPLTALATSGPAAVEGLRLGAPLASLVVEAAAVVALAPEVAAQWEAWATNEAPIGAAERVRLQHSLRTPPRGGVMGPMGLF